MINPLRFRPPQQDDVDHDGKVVDDWQDNGLSNFLAWASATLLPNWCQTETHLTNRLADALWTSCPCCMIFRGLVLGFAFGVVVVGLVTCLILFAS